ncbi:hypothetical protein [Tardiphaga sp.]|jgi:hypothetical protein|uniref:hypothetical protein n=1 Tax=Tardiphaga sp. TaxID=1926292 RepID=UPI0037D9C3FD
MLKVILRTIERALAAPAKWCDPFAIANLEIAVPTVQYTVSLDKVLADRIDHAAGKAGMTGSAFVAECVVQNFETTSRFLFLIDRMELVDQGLIDLATFVGEALSGNVHSNASESGSSHTSAE